jgi:hypothetical protein
LPPNTTAKLQPLDAGIIQNFKVHYRRRLLKRMLMALDSMTEFTVSVRDAIDIADAAWNSVSATTIASCFRHVGFVQEGVVLAEQVASNDDTDNIWSIMQQHLGVTTGFDEYAAVDNALVTSQAVTVEQIVADVVAARNNTPVDSQSDDEEAAVDTTQPIATPDAYRALRDLRLFLSNNSESNFSNVLNNIEDEIARISITRFSQKRITDYMSTSKADRSEEQPDKAQLDSVLNAGIRADSGSALCRVCQQECGGAHRCAVCDQHVHAICGVSDGDEGYGATVTCFLCRPQ